MGQAVKCSNCDGLAQQQKCSILCGTCEAMYLANKPVQGRFGTIQLKPEPWPEEEENEQDVAEDAGQLPLFDYSEKDPLT